MNKLTLTWLVYWIRTARSVFTGAWLKWPNTAGQYSALKKPSKNTQRHTFECPSGFHPNNWRSEWNPPWSRPSRRHLSRGQSWCHGAWKFPPWRLVSVQFHRGRRARFWGTDHNPSSTCIPWLDSPQSTNQQKKTRLTWPNDAMTQWCHDPMMPWPKDAMVQWCHGPMMPWPNDAMTHWCHGPWHDAMTHWCHGPASRKKKVEKKCWMKRKENEDALVWGSRGRSWRGPFRNFPSSRHTSTKVSVAKTLVK